MAITEVGSGAVANNSTGAPSITHGLGGSLQAGDLLLFFINHNTAGTAFGDNNGSTPTTIIYQEPGHTSGHRVGCAYRVWQAGDPASFAWTSGSNRWGVICRAFRGVHSGIWDVQISASTRTQADSAGPAIAPTMTTTYADALGLFINYMDSNTITFSAHDNGYGAVLSQSAGEGITTAFRTWASPGSTGATQCTLSGTEKWTAHQFALRPAEVAAAKRPGSTHVGVAVSRASSW